MKSQEHCDEYCMFVNENFQYGEGGFSWSFLDYCPERHKENFKPIYIYKQSVAEIIRQYQQSNKKLADGLHKVILEHYRPKTQKEPDWAEIEYWQDYLEKTQWNNKYPLGA